MAHQLFQAIALCTAMILSLALANPDVLGEMLPSKAASGSRRLLRVAADDPTSTQAATVPETPKPTDAAAPAGYTVITLPVQREAQNAALNAESADDGSAAEQILQGAAGAAQPGQTQAQQALTALTGLTQGASTVLQSDAVTEQGQSGADANTAGGVLRGASSILNSQNACLECEQQCKAAGGELQEVPVCTKPTDVIDECVCLKKIDGQ